MKQNVGGTDRGVRIAVGAALILLGLAGVFTGWMVTAAYVVGAAVLLSGIFRFCGLYIPLGINTCKPKGRPKQAA